MLDDYNITLLLNGTPISPIITAPLKAAHISWILKDLYYACCIREVVLQIQYQTPNLLKAPNLAQDIDRIEADVERFCGSSTYNLESRIESLRHGLMYIIPYWDSRLGGTYSLRQLEDFKDGNEFIDYWLRKVDCSSESSCAGGECLWHTADYFYLCSYPEDGKNDWVKCAEEALENLESVQHVEELSLSISDKFRTSKHGLGLLICFHKSTANCSFKNWDEIRPLIHDMFLRMKDFPLRAMRIFKQRLANVDKKCKNSTLTEEIASCVAYWRYIRNFRALNLTSEYSCELEYETFVCFADDLRYLLFTLLSDLPPQMAKDLKRILGQLDEIRCALSPTWIKTFVDSGISYAIARDIYILADKAYEIISDLDTHDCDRKSRNISCTQQKIAHIRCDVRKIYSKYNISSICIGNFVRCARLILEEIFLCNTPATRYVKALNLLHTFTKDAGNRLLVYMEIQDKYQKIQLIFCDAWMQLWSLCLRGLKSRNEFLTLSLDIFKDVTATMPRPSDLLLDLIQYLVQMPKAYELLPELQGSLVTAKDDHLYVKVIEAAHNYILSCTEFKYKTRSVLKEEVKVFNASLIHAYDRVAKHGAASLRSERRSQGLKEEVKLPSMELPPLSEFEFFDMLVNLTELKERDTYNSDQIGALHDDLSICFSFLQPYTMRHDEPVEIKLLWTQLMKLGHKLNYMIDIFEEFPNWHSKLQVFSEEAKLIKENLPKISSRNTSNSEVEGSGARSENPMEKGHATEHSKDEVSFEEEDRLRAQLTTGSRSLEKISIVGMPGLGKTTLAMRLYKDCAKSFTAHAWCYVGQEFQRNELLQYIIGQISERPKSEMNAMRVEDLAKLLKQCLLQKKNYLIVLDDAWDVDAWDALRICFPPSSNGSRILITSRNSIVGEKVCGDRNVVKLNLLTPDKSWHLLQKKVFGTRSYYPKRLCEVGKVIAEKCGGLPLSIVMIAGVLKNKNETEDGWKEIERSLDDHLLNAVSSTLELSYRHLSFRMKQCFLYCAAFSKGTEIPRSKLIRLWLAERFVETSYEQESLECAAEKYLCDLVDRNLLTVVKRGSDHRIQACRIHDLLLDFCTQKAIAEKFLITMDRWDDPASRQKRGRLCATDNELIQFSFEVSTHLKPRSLICFQSLLEPWKPTSFVFENFKSLTLLDLERLGMDECFSASVGELTLLRYLSIRGWMKSIPSSISRLLNLETLIVRGTRGEVEVPHTIFNLSKLRDLLVDKRARVCVHPSNDNFLNNLQSFSNPVLSWRIANQIIVRLPNLRKLRCILSEKWFNLSILDRLCHLESLKVFYQSLDPFCGKLSFPSNLHKLTLSGFQLPWSEVEKIAALLPRLENLKLLFRAFKGEQWTTTGTFKNLKYLRMEGLNIKEWEASDDNFPSLERLVVRRCKSLHKIPEEFGNMGGLMGIEAHWCDASLGKSVLRIKRDQIDGGNMNFEAIIYPPVLDLSDDEELSE